MYLCHMVLLVSMIQTLSNTVVTKGALEEEVRSLRAVLSQTVLELQTTTTLLEQEKAEKTAATEQIRHLQHQLDWFKRQLFGAKTERRLMTEKDFSQLPLFSELQTPDTPPIQELNKPPQSVKAYERAQRDTKITFVADDSKLKFTDDVPVETIELPNPDLEDLIEGVDYKVIGEKVTYKLAQRKSPYVVLKYIQQVTKLVCSQQLSTPSLPTPIIEQSIADVSFLAAMVVDKYLYHLPLYRQHQRMQKAGVYLGRSTLTKLTHRVAELLEPIQKALLSSILHSSILTIDETPLRAGRSKGKMKQSYFWPLYGDQDEIVFLFSSSRGRTLLDKSLQGFQGILLSDGYAAYKSYQINVAPDTVDSAQCWVHTRRKFREAEKVQPLLSKKVLDYIGHLFAIEKQYAETSLHEQARARKELSSSVVQSIFNFLETSLREEPLVPSDLFVKAAHYTLTRKKELSLFIDNPQLPLDTNHIERQIRPVAVGRKNWLFCFTEVGAHVSAMLFSLIGSCKLAGIDPYVYLIDVLQRIQTHPIQKVHLLTPRLWKIHFADKKMTSLLNK